jgi:hypothetical protein
MTLPTYFSTDRAFRAVPLALAAWLSLSGCKSQKRDPAAAASASAAASAARPPVEATPTTPIGPMMPIQPGVGLGPIRFGANVGTIERLMKAPCDVKTDTLCRYVNQAVEFRLKDGGTEQMYVPCHERMTTDASGNRRHFGYFHGLIVPNIALGMLPSALEEKLGKASKSETVSEPNEQHTARRDTYPGMVVEYDRHPSGSLMLCGVTLTKSDQKP